MVRAVDYKRNGERGEGPWIFILFLVGIGVVLFVGDFVMSWIYDTKEKRVEQAHGKKGEKVVDPTPTPKEFGSYTVEFNK